MASKVSDAPKTISTTIWQDLVKNIGILPDIKVCNNSSRGIVENCISSITTHLEVDATKDLCNIYHICIRYLDQHYYNKVLKDPCLCFDYRVKLMYYKRKCKGLTFQDIETLGFYLLGEMQKLLEQEGEYVPKLSKNINTNKQVAKSVVGVVLDVLECFQARESKIWPEYKIILFSVHQVRPWLGLVDDSLKLRIGKILCEFTFDTIRKLDVKKVVELAIGFCKETCMLYNNIASSNDDMFQVGQRVCKLCFEASKANFSSHLTIIEIVLDALAARCEADPLFHPYFLDLLDYCILEFQDITDCKLVALSLAKLAKEVRVSENNKSFRHLLDLYAVNFVINDVKLYKELDKSIDANSKSIKVLTQLENQLKTIKSDNETTRWQESYSAAIRFLCPKISRLIKSNYKEIIDHRLKDVFDPIDLPNIVETLFNEISNSEWKTNKNNINRATYAAEACFILSLITNQKTAECLETIESLINSSSEDDVQKCLFTNLPDVSEALFKANSKEEAKVSLKLFCQAAWDRVIWFCKMFHSRKKGEFLEDSISSLVTKASKASALYIKLVNKDDCDRMVKHFIDRWNEAHGYFPILSPVDLVSQWVKIQCEERQVPGDVPMLHSIVPCLKNNQEILGIILNQELQCYQEKKMTDLNENLCALMQNAITDFIEKIPGWIKDSEKRYNDLIITGTQLRDLGVEGLKDYTAYISQAIVVLTELSKKEENYRHYIPDAYCLRALCTREAKPKSKDFMNDIQLALKMWLDEKQPRFGDFELLLYVLDLLSLEGYTHEQSTMCTIIMKFLKFKGYSSDEWVDVLGKYRCIGDHATCGSPVDDAFIKTLAECHKELDDVSFWKENTNSEAVQVGFELSLYLDCTISSPDSCNNDDNRLSDIKGQVKKAVSNLIKNDNSTESKIKTNTFLAAQLYFELAQRMIDKGLLSEALTYAKESLYWRLEHSESCFTMDIKEKRFSVKSNVATPASFFGTSSNTELTRTPWRALQCTLESYLQVGCIYNLLGDGYEAKTHIGAGIRLSQMFDLGIYSVRFYCELGNLFSKQCNYEKAGHLLQRAKKKLKDSRPHSFCMKCETVLDVLVKQQLSNLYFSSGKKFGEVVASYSDGDRLLHDPKWENDVSSPMQESERTTDFCHIIRKDCTNCGCQKKCWHCQPTSVAALLSVKVSLEMKWECIRRRLWIRVLTMIGTYHGDRGETTDELDVLFKSISVLVSRSTFKGSSFPVSVDFVNSMIHDNWTGESCSIEHASVLYQICCCFLKSMNKNDTSNQTEKISTIVRGLKLSYLLGREVPDLCQKVSRLLSVIYILSFSNKNFVLSSTSLSPRYSAAYFHQASIGTHFNHMFVSRVKRMEDEFMEKNQNFNDPAMLPSSRNHCLWLPPRWVKDLDNFISQFFKGLPEIIIVCIDFLDDVIEKLLGDLMPCSSTKSWIIISRLNSGNMPSSGIHPIQTIIQKTTLDPDTNKESTGNPWVCHWRGTIVDRIATEFESIHETAHNIWNTGVKVNDERRKELDKRLSCFISDIESSWIGPLKNLLLGGWSNDTGFTECSREPMILNIGYDLQMIPLENMQILEKQEVYRMPSVVSIVSTLSMRSYHEHGDFNHTNVFPKIDPSNAYYLLNVDGDLNFKIDESWFKKLNIKGMMMTKPSVDELISALTTHDLYIYISHGSGGQFIAANKVQNLHKCAGALLMGCDSGRVTLCGSLAPTGAPTAYLLGGSPFICCNLWSMGDIEVGQFSRELVLDLISAMKRVAQNLHYLNDQQGPSKKRKLDAPVNIGSFLIKCRKSCQLRYLSGASTICFGLPTSICSKGFVDDHSCDRGNELSSH